jgi:hypothetical protein
MRQSSPPRGLGSQWQQWKGHRPLGPRPRIRYLDAQKRGSKVPTPGYQVADLGERGRGPPGARGGWRSCGAGKECGSVARAWR